MNWQVIIIISLISACLFFKLLSNYMKRGSEVKKKSIKESIKTFKSVKKAK